jgi:hypothetical protein
LAVGAYASGYFLIGDAANNGNFTAQAVNDAGTMVSAGNLGVIYQVASDGTHFAFTTTDGSFLYLHVVDAGVFTRNANPCKGDAFGLHGEPISVASTNVGWVFLAGQFQQLKIGPVSGGTCGNILNSNEYGTMAGSNAVGLINGTDALVVSAFGASSQVMLLRTGAGTSEKLDNVTTGFPKSIVVGAGHYAAIVTGSTPAVLGF